MARSILANGSIIHSNSYKGFHIHAFYTNTTNGTNGCTYLPTAKLGLHMGIVIGKHINLASCIINATMG